MKLAAVVPSPNGLAPCRDDHAHNPRKDADHGHSLETRPGDPRSDRVAPPLICRSFAKNELASASIGLPSASLAPVEPAHTGKKAHETEPKREHPEQAHHCEPLDE